MNELHLNCCIMKTKAHPAMIIVGCALIMLWSRVVHHQPVSIFKLKAQWIQNVQLSLLSSALVNFHLLDSVQCSEAIMAGTSFETLEGNSIVIGCDGQSLTVNGIKMVFKKDIVTTNGVIHLIDQVLMPDSG